jgi:energy-coupling factor transport system ATP-binding protein
MGNAIKTENLRFKYRDGAQTALESITFSQNEGEFVVIMGHSGAGKSTFARCTNRIIPTFFRGELSGSVHILGENTEGKTVAQLARSLGMVFQDFETQLFCTSVELEVAFGLENLRLGRVEIVPRVEDALRSVGLNGCERREPTTLSGGQKQRLALASVLAMKPPIIVMDEATTDLDPQGKSDMFRIWRALRREGVTLLCIDHETEEALNADRVVLLREGKIAAEGAPREILANVELLNQCAVRPIQTAELFAELASTRRPLTVEEAQSALKEEGWILDPDACQQIEREDKQISDEAAIEVENLTYCYEETRTPALEEVSLKINRGDFVALIGQNGSGKTTLVKHFNRLLKPMRGRVKIFGQDAGQLSTKEIARKVGYLFQNPDYQIFAPTVEAEVAFGPTNLGISGSQLRERIARSLEAVGLSYAAGRDPVTLSQGERQRLAIASVIACDPEIIIFDEPATGLDWQLQKNVMELARSLQNRGKTIIVVTHSMRLVSEYARRVIVMSNGKVVLDGSAREVFSDSARIESLSLALTQIVRLSQKFGKTLLTVKELARCLRRKETFEKC